MKNKSESKKNSKKNSKLNEKRIKNASKKKTYLMNNKIAFQRAIKEYGSLESLLKSKFSNANLPIFCHVRDGCIHVKLEKYKYIIDYNIESVDSIPVGVYFEYKYYRGQKTIKSNSSVDLDGFKSEKVKSETYHSSLPYHFLAFFNENILK